MHRASLEAHGAQQYSGQAIRTSSWPYPAGGPVLWTAVRARPFRAVGSARNWAGRNSVGRQRTGGGPGSSGVGIAAKAGRRPDGPVNCWWGRDHQHPMERDAELKAQGLSFDPIKDFAPDSCG